MEKISNFRDFIWMEKTSNFRDFIWKKVLIGGDDFLCASWSRKKHLVRCSNGKSVGIESLRGKTVGILFFSLLQPRYKSRPFQLREVYDPARNSPYPREVKELKEVYERIRKKEGDVFEIVFVAALGDDKENWDKIVPTMPWLAVPFEDWTWMRALRLKYGDAVDVDTAEIQIVDGTSDRHLLKGSRLSIGSLLPIVNCGPDCYPFTAERFAEIGSARARLLLSKSLKDVFGGSGSDFLLRCGDSGITKVPISKLKRGEIFIYTCYTRPFRYKNEKLHISGQDKKLLEFLLEISPSYPDLKIVFINADHRGGYTTQKAFLQVLKRLPNNWFALPFKDEKIWNLTNVLPHFTVIGAGNIGLYFNGLQNIVRYGREAYPFTPNGVVKAEMKRLTQLRLSQVLEAFRINLVYKMNNNNKLQQQSVVDYLDACDKGVLLYIHADHVEDGLSPPPIDSRLLEEGSLEVLYFYLGPCNERHTLEDFHIRPGHWSAFPKHCPACFEKLAVSFLEDEHVIVFKPRGNLLKVGNLESSGGNLLKVGTLESFGRNGVFPYISDEDFEKTVRLLVNMGHY